MGPFSSYDLVTTAVFSTGWRSSSATGINLHANHTARYNSVCTYTPVARFQRSFAGRTDASLDSPDREYDLIRGRWGFPMGSKVLIKDHDHALGIRQ